MADNRTRMQRAKGYDPEPMDVPPLFRSPSQPVAMVRWLLTKYLWPQSLLWIGLAVVTQSRDAFSRLLGLGILLTVGLQALINLSVVTVLVPTKGIALPLVSAGGTGWIMTAFMLGLVAALDNAHFIRCAERGEVVKP